MSDNTGPTIPYISTTTTTSGAARTRVDLNLLAVFDVVMTERHVSRAAERLGMTQSAVSNALNRLRHRFEDRLFIKAARGVEPTRIAMTLWPAIHKALQELDQSIRPQVFDPQTDGRQFRIAVVDITAMLLAGLLHVRTHAQSPATRVLFVPYNTSSNASALMRGEIDFGIGIQPPRISAIETTQLWSDSFCVVARRGHPLLNAPISLDTFCKAPQLAINESGEKEAFNLVDVALEDLGLARHVAMSVNQFLVVPDILQCSSLIAVLPRKMAVSAQLAGRVAIQPMPFHMPDVSIFLSWHQRNKHAPAHLWMKQSIVELAANLA